MDVRAQQSGNQSRTKFYHQLYYVAKHREIARTTYRIVTWGEDADGEIYFIDFTGGGIYQLVKAENQEKTKAKNGKGFLDRANYSIFLLREKTN